MRDPLLQGVDRLGLARGRGFDERPDLVGEEVRIAASHGRLRRGLLLALAEQLPEEAAAALLLHIRCRRHQLRNGVRLDVLRAG